MTIDTPSEFLALLTEIACDRARYPGVSTAIDLLLALAPFAPAINALVKEALRQRRRRG